MPRTMNPSSAQATSVDQRNGLPAQTRIVGRVQDRGLRIPVPEQDEPVPIGQGLPALGDRASI